MMIVQASDAGFSEAFFTDIPEGQRLPGPAGFAGVRPAPGAGHRARHGLDVQWA